MALFKILGDLTIERQQGDWCLLHVSRSRAPQPQLQRQGMLFSEYSWCVPRTFPHCDLVLSKTDETGSPCTSTNFSKIAASGQVHSTTRQATRPACQWSGVHGHVAVLQMPPYSPFNRQNARTLKFARQVCKRHRFVIPRWRRGCHGWRQRKPDAVGSSMHRALFPGGIY